MAELPALKILNKDYAGENLQFISIAHRSTNDADFQSAIKKYEMDWIHIYDDEKLFDLFGNQATPRICLIDLDGKKVYDSFDFPGGDQDMLELKRVLSSKLNGK